MGGLVLVLGAGGIRGWAHVGVLKVLHQAQLPIQAIVGASAGSLIGALYAAHRDVGLMLEVASSANVASLTTWFLGGLKIGPDAPGFGRRLWQAYGHLDFGEMAIAFRAAALDVATGERVLIGSGNVGRAVEASIRPPGLLPPVLIGGRPLVDGGLHDTVPTALAIAAFPQLTTVAVPVGEFIVLPKALQPISRQASRVIWGLGVDPRSRIGGLAFMAHLLSQGRPQRLPPQAYIVPRLRGIMAILPFRIEEAIRRGEKAARAALPYLRQLFQG